jgi:hypothetical protein
MPFVDIAGLKGKVYVPEGASDQPKKHSCRDCFACQVCSDERCDVCRNRGGCKAKLYSQKTS